MIGLGDERWYVFSEAVGTEIPPPPAPPARGGEQRSPSPWRGRLGGGETGSLNAYERCSGGENGVFRVVRGMFCWACSGWSWPSECFFPVSRHWRNGWGGPVTGNLKRGVVRFSESLPVIVLRVRSSNRNSTGFPARWNANPEVSPRSRFGELFWEPRENPLARCSLVCLRRKCFPVVTPRRRTP